MLISVSKFAHIPSLSMSCPWSQFSSRDNPEWWLCPLRTDMAWGPGNLQENLFLRTSAHPTRVAGFALSCPFPQILPSCGTPEVFFFLLWPLLYRTFEIWQAPTFCSSGEHLKPGSSPRNWNKIRPGWASIREVWFYHIFTRTLLGWNQEPSNWLCGLIQSDILSKILCVLHESLAMPLNLFIQ